MGRQHSKRRALIALLAAAPIGLSGIAAMVETPTLAQNAVEKSKGKSGYDYLEKSTKRMQDDDFANPGFFAVEAGGELWRKPDGKAGKSCSSCHRTAAKSMRGVGARYPAWDEALNKVINLEQRINRCRVRHMKAAPLKYEGDGLLSLTAWVRHQSRGMPVNVKIGGPSKASYQRGKAFWFRRRGLFDVSCAQCHDQKAGLRLRAEIVSEGQINGFPAYKLKWQKVGSSHRQFRRCNRLARSVPFAFGSQNYVDLELYVAWRGRSLKVETPAVRP